MRLLKKGSAAPEYAFLWYLVKYKAFLLHAYVLRFHCVFKSPQCRVASFQLENPSTVNDRSQLPFDTVTFFVSLAWPDYFSFINGIADCNVGW